MMVRLSNERGEQLRAYAEAQGLGVTDAVGALLKIAGAADRVPGFHVIPVRFGPDTPILSYLLKIGDDVTAPMSAANLLTLADNLDHAAHNTRTGGREVTYSGNKHGVIATARHRRHVVALVAKSLPDGPAVQRLLTLDLAQDLASQLRRAVA